MQGHVRGGMSGGQGLRLVSIRVAPGISSNGVSTHIDSLFRIRLLYHTDRGVGNQD